MKKRVVWSRDALDELKEIVGYLARDNPPAARKVAAVIRAAGAKLGSMATGRRGRVGGTYEKSVQGMQYIVVYAIEPLPGMGESVVILRVIHTSRNWPEQGWPQP